MDNKTRGLMGKKLGCTQVFDDKGQQVAVTAVELGPCVVTALRTPDKNGYEAVQIAFQKKSKPLSKPRDGYFKKLGVDAHAYLKEFRIPVADLAVGQTLDVSLFKKDDYVDVRGVSRGKGFQGTVKRHHFSRGHMTHGSKFHRIPGSSGSGTCPGTIKKGKRRAGHMGNELACGRNLRVVEVLADKHVILLRGSVPGAIGGLVWVEG